MKKFLFLLILSLLALNKIQCTIDCSTCTKDSSNKICSCNGDDFKDCRWMKINSDEDLCLECTGIEDGESKYYSRKYSTENKPFCHKVGITGYSGAKMIYGTKQIVSNCKEYGLFNLGDFCYDSCPENSKDNSDKMCKCENLFYRTIVEGLTYYNCIKDGDPCPEGYFYRNDKECVKACPKGKPYLEKVEETKDYICKSQCPFNLKIYSEEAPLGNKNNTYCLQKCPDNAKFYYDDDNICIEKCSRNKNDFYNSNNKCVNNNNVKSADCGNYYYIKISEDENIFQCVQSQTQNIDCPEGFPYKYIIANSKTYCLKACDDTNIDFFDNVKTYLYTEKNECKDITQIKALKLFIIEKEKRIVDDCSKEIYFPFYDENNNCVPNCGDKYIDNESNKCVDICDYFKDEETKTCFKKCPAYIGRGFHYENNTCTSCGMDEKGKGFHLINDDICYSQCPDGFKHNHNNNICYEGVCKDYDYKFSYKEEPKTCYYTCLDIGNDYYIEKDYECYKQNDIENDDSFKNYFFYETEYDNRKYIKYFDENIALEECFKRGFKYLKGKQCVEKCNNNDGENDNEYKYSIFPTKDKFGICFKELSDCQKNNYKFFNFSNICSQKCDYYTLKDSTGNTKIEEDNKSSNCFLECPSLYPYLDNNICKEKCEDCYIEEDGIKKCVSKNNYFIKKIGEHNKCVKYCTDSINEIDNYGAPKFSYYNSNNICLDSCTENQGNNKFSYEATNTHQQCLPSCKSNEYYYEDKKICLKKCDKYIKSKTSRICVDKCENGELILPGNICSIPNDKDAPFYIEESIEETIFKKYFQSCLLIPDDYIAFDPETYKCLKESELGEKFFYHGGIYGLCPDGLSQDENNKCKVNPDNSEECNEYITTALECVDRCPIGEHFIEYDNTRNCVSKCGEGKFYVKEDNSNENESYSIYKCVDKCSGDKPVHIENSKECIANCGNLYEIEIKNIDGEVDERICYSSCPKGDGIPNQFLTYDPSIFKYICSNGCHTDFPYSDNANKICENECSFLSSKIAKKITIEGNEDQYFCVNECNNNDDNGYFYLEIKEDNKLYCSKNCQRYKEIQKTESDNDFIKMCVPKCEKPNNYLDGNKCLLECNNNQKFTEIDGEYICSETCDDNYYTYKDENLCLKSCYPDDYVEKVSKTCTNDCTSLNEGSNEYYFYDSDETIKENICVKNCAETQKPFTRKNNHCDIGCDSNPLGDYYYLEGTKICITKSECQDKKIDGRICKDTCYSQDNSLEIKYEDAENGFCLPNCYYSTLGYIYYSDDDNDSKYICKNEYLNSIIENNLIISSCTSEQFKFENQCINECPKGLTFTTENNNCLNDCIEENQYYTSITISSKILLKCEANNCNAYTILDTRKKGKYCLGNECKYPYQFFISDEYPKECFEKCPENGNKNYYYLFNSELSIFKCIGKESIPIDDDKYILYKNTTQYIKTSECYPNYVDYEKSECIIKCPEGKAIYIKEDNPKINYCINKDNCKSLGDNLVLDLNSKKCIPKSSCSLNKEIKTLDTIERCECTNLFYIDISSGIKVCIEENNCINQLEYPYLEEGTDGIAQCINACEGILSLNGLICYPNEYNCPSNSKIQTLSNNLKQCVCDDKFYYYETEDSKEIYCLPKDSKCPRNETINRELFISDTKECVEYCPLGKYSMKFGKTCVDSCPTESKTVNDECICEDKWYTNEKEEMICVNECPVNKSILIDKTKECVESCINTEYPVYYRNKCYSNCDDFSGTIKIEKIHKIENIPEEYKKHHLNETYGQFGQNICYCKKAWFEDGTNYGCDDSTDNIDTNDNPCKVFDNIFSYKYIVLQTNQCVKKCPEIYKYSFNEYCYENCEENNLLTSGDSCICPKLWKYDNNDIKCLEEENCEENSLLIVATNECYLSTQCKEEYPLLFNKKCYDTTNCPENSLYKEDSPRTCSCVKYYYIDSNDYEIKCLPENNNCPSEYPNLIFSSNKCVKDEDNELIDLYNFNGIYYNNCPLYTKYDSDKDLCVCDFIYGFWYKESNNLECGLKECPEELPKYLGSTRECIKKCSSEEQKYVEYNGICYEECPELTKENENGICELQTTNDSNNVTEITKIIEDNIVHLYTASTEKENEDEDDGDISNIIELTNSNLTVEFYGVNKNKKDKKEKHNNKNKLSSSLSFIDLSECIEKIYESNNMGPDDDIIILKYDLKDTPKEYLINPVEYKFINSRNGKELDASACGHGSIKISYPFFNIISNYDNLTKKKRNLKSIMLDLKNENDLTTLSEKYNLGKEINDQYSSIDTFNSKNNIYTDFCTSIEINGKDLILEDRMNYLLPHYSLCEKNCSYNHTDFEEERIYCDCSFKNEFDLNREHEAEIELNENAVIISQNGKTNFPVLKCISVLGDSKRIKKNISFYYMLIIIIIEICLLIMTLLFGIKSFTEFFGNKMYDNDITENDIIQINEKDKDNNNKKYEDEIIKTTQRALNAPPVKKNNEDNNEKNGIEFIPEEFLFLYFNESDKGVRKQIEKNELPFNINPNTKVLLQKMENVDYSIVKASGPFHEEQNLIEIIDNNNKEDVNFNIESINETIDNNRNENIRNQNELNDNGLITISEEKIYKKENLKDYIINEYDEIVENKNKEIKKNNTFLNEMKLEQRLLTKDYDFVADRNTKNLLTLILVEIFDKIYIIKNILFIRKYEIMYLYLSVYALYHVILLTILAMFYDINTIKNIWNKENYPGFGLHLGYGILSILISWIIYIIIMCLLTNKGKYNEIMNIKNSKKRKKNNKIQLINKKCNSLISKMKIKIIVYYIIQFLLIIAFFIYLVTLGAVYSGTIKKIFSTYGIAILELIIIKIIYGIILALLRHYSLSNKKEGLYNIIIIFDKYIV